MRIAFLVNHEKTVFFHALARRIEAAGHEVRWISPSRRWALWLVEQGVPAAHILDVTAWGRAWRDASPLGAEELNELRWLEDDPGPAVNDMILMDRLLRERPRLQALRYIHRCALQIREFLVAERVAVVLGEKTWAIELVAARVCRRLRRLSCTPQTVRIPGERFAFYVGLEERQLVPLRPPDEGDQAAAESCLARFLAEKPKPRYFHLMNRLPQVRFNWSYKLLNQVSLTLRDPYNETRFPVSWLVRTRVGEVANRFGMALLAAFETPPLPPPAPFVLLTLHKQPEASIDVLGSHLSNQLETIRALARTLPAGAELWVKEHSNAIGDRPPAFFAAARQLPGVRLISPFLNSFDLMPHASLTLAVSGTACYEAGLLGLPAATMAPMFFADLMVVSQFNPYAESLAALLTRSREQGGAARSRERRLAFLARLHACSHPGNVSDPRSDPSCMEPENLASVAEGILRLLAWAGRSHAATAPPAPA